MFSIDLDGDGDDDVATANAQSDDVSILLGNDGGVYMSTNGGLLTPYKLGNSPAHGALATGSKS